MSRLAGVKADHKYGHKKLESIADDVRKGLNIGSCEAIDPLRFFEDLHEIGITGVTSSSIPLRSGVISLDDSEGYARYDSQNRCIEVLASETTYDWLQRGHPRAAFFVAHELGHCLLHTHQLMRLAKMPTKQQTAFHRGLSDHKPYEDTEWQANGFAGCLLMPARGLAALEEQHGALSAGVIRDTFKVSYEAAGVRLNIFAERKGELLRI